jgi:prepilin-type N-terminal cleavage/methylation domain-containing protein
MTTSATGDRRGFTLLEILLALALVALLATLFIGGSAALIADKPLTPDDVFWKVTQQARKTALTGTNDVVVTFDPKNIAFVIDDTVTPVTVPIPNNPDLVVDFLSTQKGTSAVLVGGVAMETQTIPFVMFYTDGTCSPFKVQFRNKVGAHVLGIDPWTCAQVLTPPPP